MPPEADMTERSGNRHIHVWRRGAFRRGEEGDGAGGKAVTLGGPGGRASVRDGTPGHWSVWVC